jgi:hypothetical protein
VRSGQSAGGQPRWKSGKEIRARRDDGRARLAAPSDALRLTAWCASSFMAQINLMAAGAATALVKQG